MDDTSLKTLKHLEACAAALPPTLTQCLISVNYAARDLQGEKVKQDQTKSDFCQFCFNKIDVTKAKIAIESKKSRKRLGKGTKGEDVKSEVQVTCHFCKKICVAKCLPLAPKIAPIENKTQSVAVKEDGEPSKKKKKRNKKDPNAGLIIPGKSVSVQAKPAEKSKVSISKEKLNHLMSLNNSGRKGGLKDFLK